MILKWNFLSALHNVITLLMKSVKDVVFKDQWDHRFALKRFKKFRLHKYKKTMSTNSISTDYERIKLSILANETEWLLAALPKSSRFETLLKRLG